MPVSFRVLFHGCSLELERKCALLGFLHLRAFSRPLFPEHCLAESRVVGEENRGWTYGLMRLPLNVFVTAMLGTIGEGQ